MKLRLLKLTPEQLIHALEGKPSKLNLPRDLELLDIKYDVFNRQVTAVVRSDSFEDVPETMPIPELTPSVSSPIPVSAPPTAPKLPAQPSVQAAPSKTLISTLTASTQPSTSASIGTGVKTLPKPESNQDTGGLEDEFTKEQRKVLRFAVDGDFVIVKPTQFLKTEWEDINDTVKSIGGQWVKGDIINYWIIPKNPKPSE
jgi:hypothetical protein